jgi:hypothetical protein
MFHSSDNSLSVQLFCCYLQICLISFEYHKGFVLLIIHWQWGTVENQTLRQKRRLQFFYCEISISISRLSPDMTNYRVCYMSGTAGDARGKEAAYPSGAPELIPGFEWGSCYSIFSFMCCYVDHRLCVVVSFYFGHGVICPSIFYVLKAPLVCSTLFYVNIFVPHVLGELYKIKRIILNVWCKYHFINITYLCNENSMC